MKYGEDTFRDFYYSTYDVLYKYVRRMNGAENLIEDIVQETYCEAYKCREKLYNHPNPVGWLYKTANYIFKNASRRMENNLLSLELIGESDVIPSIRGGYEAVEWQVLMQDILSQKDSELIYKYYMEGYTSVEIAAQLGISEDNVRMKLSRIRKKMKKNLAN